MKISQLVTTKTKTPYHESVAGRLPRGIKSQQQLLNLGYRIAVEDLGLTKAKTLNENFAIKLINSYHTQCLNEGIGSFLGKAAGHVVGAVGAAGRGIKGAWDDAKQGYQQGKAWWGSGEGPTASGAAPAAGGAAPAAGGAAPAAGSPTTTTLTNPGNNNAPGGSAEPEAAPSPGGATPTPPAAGTPPTTGGKGVGDIMKAIDGLDPASKKQLAGELDKSIKAAPPAGAAPAGAEDPNSGTKTGTTNPGDWAADGRDASAADHATPANVKPAAGGTTPQPDELDAVKKNAGLPTGATTPAAGATTPAAPGATPPAAPGATPPAAKAPVTGTSGGAGKSMMDLKGAGVSNASQLANLQKTGAANLAAEKGAANMNIQKPTFAADKRTPAQIAKMKQAGFREEVEFHSNFLGRKI